jgi:hypothetical protein
MLHLGGLRIVLQLEERVGHGSEPKRAHDLRTRYGSGDQALGCAYRSAVAFLAAAVLDT